MHAAAYHLQDALKRFGSVKQFSGQGNCLLICPKHWFKCSFSPQSYPTMHLKNLQKFVILAFFTGVEKNNDVIRATVLHKSRNWDSPADVMRAEHRLEKLNHRQRGKRKYTKHDDEFWNTGKKELMSKIRKKCISSKNAHASITNENINIDNIVTTPAVLTTRTNSSSKSNKKRKSVNSKKKAQTAAKKVAKKK